MLPALVQCARLSPIPDVLMFAKRARIEAPIREWTSCTSRTLKSSASTDVVTASGPTVSQRHQRNSCAITTPDGLVVAERHSQLSTPRYLPRIGALSAPSTMSPFPRPSKQCWARFSARPSSATPPLHPHPGPQTEWLMIGRIAVTALHPPRSLP